MCDRRQGWALLGHVSCSVDSCLQHLIENIGALACCMLHPALSWTFPGSVRRIMMLSGVCVVIHAPVVCPLHVYVLLLVRSARMRLRCVQSPRRSCRSTKRRRRCDFKGCAFDLYWTARLSVTVRSMYVMCTGPSVSFIANQACISLYLICSGPNISPCTLAAGFICSSGRSALIIVL